MGLFQITIPFKDTPPPLFDDFLQKLQGVIQSDIRIDRMQGEEGAILEHFSQEDDLSIGLNSMMTAYIIHSEFYLGYLTVSCVYSLEIMGGNAKHWYKKELPPWAGLSWEEKQQWEREHHKPGFWRFLGFRK